MYSIRGLSFAYPGKAEIFSGFDLEIPAGAAIILTGENGSGKSTLLRLISGILSPSAGKISLQDQPISGDQAHPGQYYFPQNPLDGVIGISPKDDYLIWQMALGESMDAPSLQTLEARLGELWEQAWFRMSSGQLRKSALAILPWLQDAYWLLDEPFAGLDTEAAQALLQVLQTKQSSAKPGMLIVSHDPQLPGLLGARSINLDDLK